MRDCNSKINENLHDHYKLIMIKLPKLWLRTVLSQILYPIENWLRFRPIQVSSVKLVLDRFVYFACREKDKSFDVLSN